MTKTISRLYSSYDRASQAVRDLEAAGVPHRDISIVANNADNWYSNSGTTTKRVDRDRDGVDDRAEGAGAGAGIGAAVGGTAGLLAGLGLLAIPGVGPVVAAGWLVATAAGAAAGGVTGGILGSLTQAGVSDEDAHVYAEGVRRGGTLVTARVADGDASKLEGILDRSSLRTSDLRSSYAKTGWKSFELSGNASLGRRGSSKSHSLPIGKFEKARLHTGPFLLPSASGSAALRMAPRAKSPYRQGGKHEQKGLVEDTQNMLAAAARVGVEGVKTVGSEALGAAAAAAAGARLSSLTKRVRRCG